MFVVRGSYLDEYYKSEDDTLREWIESDTYVMSKKEGHYSIQAPAGYEILHIPPAGFAMLSIDEDGPSDLAEISVDVPINQAYYEKITLASIAMTMLSSEEFEALDLPEEDILDIPSVTSQPKTKNSPFLIIVAGLVGTAVVFLAIAGALAIIALP